MIQIWQVPSEYGPSNLVVLGLTDQLKVSLCANVVKVWPQKEIYFSMQIRLEY